MARADVMQLNGLQKNMTNEWDTFMSWLRSERGVMTQAEVLVYFSPFRLYLAGGDAVATVHSLNTCSGLLTLRHPLW
jgi:hypothetical protein